MKVFASLGARSVAFFIDALLLCVAWVSLVTFSGGQGFPLPWWSFIAMAAIYFTAVTASPWRLHRHAQRRGFRALRRQGDRSVGGMRRTSLPRAQLDVLPRCLPGRFHEAMQVTSSLVRFQ